MISAAAALLLGVAACGGDDDGGSSSSSAAAPTTAGGSPTTEAATPTTAGGSPTTAGGEPSTDAPTTTADAGDVKTGGDMEFLTYVSLSSLDPKMAASPSGTTSPGQILWIYDSLLRIATDGTITPRLALSIEPNADFSEWTLTLRDGVQFSDGTPFNAEAVKYNWERHQKPDVGSQCILQASNIATTTATSETVLDITLTKPNSQFFFLMQGCLGLIASPTALESFGADYGSTPDKTVGAGAFTVSSYTSGEEFTLTRNPNFWDAPRPYLDSVHVVGVAGDPATAAQTFLVGDADMAFFPNTGATSVLDDAGFEPLSREYIGGEGWIFNAAKPPLDDARVRRGLYLALDLDAINQAAFGGKSPMNAGFFPKGSPYDDPSLQYPARDVEEAQRLISEYLTEKGLDSIDVSMIGLSGTMDAVAVVAGQNLDEIDGVNFTFEPQPPLGMRDRVFSHSFDIAAWIAGGDAMYPSLYDSLASTSPANFTGYVDPVIDEAFATALASDDPAVIKESYQTVARQFLEQVPYAILWGSHVTTYTQDYVHGADVVNFNVVDLSTVWMDK